jgi:hypothetical protein
MHRAWGLPPMHQTVSESAAHGNHAAAICSAMHSAATYAPDCEWTVQYLASMLLPFVVLCIALPPMHQTASGQYST